MDNFHSLSVRDCAKALESSLNNGISCEEAEKRLSRDGLNRLKDKKKTPLIVRFFAQLKDFMVIVLLTAAAVSFLTELYSGGSFADPIIIIAIVLLNALMGVIQESKAERAIDALKALTAPKCTVKRNGEYTLIEADRLAVGDIIRLSQGGIVPADCRIIEAHCLKVSEASLTGESMPVEKDGDGVLPIDAPLGERRNMLYMGSSILSGRCEGLVCAVGMNSEMGKIADMLNKDREEPTPLQVRLNRTGKLLGMGALGICFVIFVIGLLRNMPFFNMFMTSVSLAVAAIPEGLPAIVTIVLAIGTKKMAERRAVVRKLPAVEALGSATVICSDKTGTLTENKMQVTEISSEDKRLTLALMAMCGDSEGAGNGVFNGEPTEKALAEAAYREGVDKEELDSLYPRIGEYPFDSSLKRMTTIHKYKGVSRCITKGAPEHIIALCTHYLKDGRAVVMDKGARERLLAVNEAMCRGALRVIAAAYKDTEGSCKSREQAEYGLTYCGMAGLLDPPRREAAKAVEQCRRAGIRPVMITGDNGATASAIGLKTGILSKGDIILTGAELDRLTEEQLLSVIDNCSVFARVTPSHKVRIVKALKAKGEIVAMTGDGINDAPALKAADIGCAMGITGTDAAKETADIVLTDDNFATIVEAVRQGRNIYENIKKAIHFLLSSNIGEIITIFAAMVMGFPSPLAPIQLLWVNLVTDSFPAVALGLDSCDEDIMLRRPEKDNALFSKELWARICLEGAMIGMLALLAFATGKAIYGDITLGRTMCFGVLSISQLIHAFNMRSEHSLLTINPLSNRYLVGALAIGVLMEITVIQLPAAAAVFKVTPLNSIQWLWVMLLSLMPVALVELEKRLSSADKE